MPDTMRPASAVCFFTALWCLAPVTAHSFVDWLLGGRFTDSLRSNGAHLLPVVVRCEPQASSNFGFEMFAPILQVILW